MHIVIIGGGVIGITSAYYLIQHGFKVTLIEKEPDTALEASGMNGAQLEYNFIEPLACLKNLPAFLKPFLFNTNSAIHFSNRFDPDLISWGIKYFLETLPHRYQKSFKSLLELSKSSQAEMLNFIKQKTFDFDYDPSGKLMLYNDKISLDKGYGFAKDLQEHGINSNRLSYAECLEKDPALEHRATPLYGGLFFPNSSRGDCQKFTQNLTTLLQKNSNFLLLLNTKVEKIITENSVIKAVQTNQEPIEADGFVMASGFSSKKLLEPLNINIPLYPMKGYSLTLNNHLNFKKSLSEMADRIVFSPLGERLRIAGMAEFDGKNQEINPKRMAFLKSRVKALYPDLDISRAETAIGMRPILPQTFPIIGNIAYKNLFLNTGHGMLGWTLALGSGKKLAQEISLFNEKKSKL